MKKNNAIEKVENIEKKYDNSATIKKENEQINADNRISLALEREKNKQIKSEAKREREREKQKRKAQKLSLKKEMKRERLKDKRKQKSKGVGGYITAIVTLGVSTLVLASSLIFVFLMPSKNDTMLESSYRQSYYDAIEQVDNIDLNMSKILATEEESALQNYLVNLAINSELLESDLQSLPLEDENKFYTTKLINQIGDYAKYLNKKIIYGESISQEDRKNLEQLYNANLTLKNALNSTLNNMSDFSFSSFNSGEKNNIVLDSFNELENLSVEYPELIYDGPFSDGKDDREIKGLTLNMLSVDDARNNFISLFNDFGITDVKDEGITEGNIRLFNFSANMKGETIFAQMSERDGKLITYTNSGSCKEVKMDGDDATSIALDFLNKMGTPNMTPVWINLYNNVYTINFAYELDEIIVYSDLIKVRVCAETGMILGIEASSYYTNHIDREVLSPTLSVNQAMEYVAGNIDVISSKLVIVPIGETNEKLCYEFMGTAFDNTFYVYIDANSGKQVQMFKVIEGSEGTLLM